MHEEHLTDPPPGRLRRAVQRLTRSDADVEAQRLQALASAQQGCTPIQQVVARQRVVVSGCVRTVTVRPRSGRPCLEAQIYDGTGLVTLCWLGRRRIPGINPGRSLQVQGLVSDNEGRLTMYNPRYELLSPNEGSLGEGVGHG